MRQILETIQEAFDMDDFKGFLYGMATFFAICVALGVFAAYFMFAK